MVGSKIYENDSYLRAGVVGNYRESDAMQFKRFEFFFFISPKDPFGKKIFKNRDNIKKLKRSPVFARNRKV